MLALVACPCPMANLFFLTRHARYSEQIVESPFLHVNGEQILVDKAAAKRAVGSLDSRA